MVVNKKQSGITLISLVITIIILLILAGTAISIGINGDNIFDKASEARERWNTAMEQESAQINELSRLLMQVGELDPIEIPEGLTKGDTINWTPSGHYTWSDEYTSLYSTITKELYSGSLVPTGAVTAWQTGDNRVDNMNFTIDTWKVLSVDNNNGTITLVPASPTSGKLVFGR